MGASGEDVPAHDVAAIHRLVTTPGLGPEEQLRDYLNLGIEMLGVGAGLVARVAARRVTVRAIVGELSAVEAIQRGDDLSGDPRIVGILDRQATVARLDSRGGDPVVLPLGSGAVVGTPIWIAGRIVGVLAFVSAAGRSVPYTPWQFGVVEMLADGVSRLLELGAAVDARLRSESTTRALLDMIPDRLYRLDDGGRLISEPRGRRVGGDAERQTDAGIDALIAPGVLAAARSSSITELARDEVRTRVFPVVDGDHVRRFEARFVRADRDEVLCIVRDVTDQARTEGALRESEERYRTVVESLAEGILIHDPSGRVYACNRSAATILQAPEHELLRTDGRVVGTRWVLPDGAPLASDNFPGLATLRTGRPAVGQVLGLERADGPARWLRVNARPLAVSGDQRLHAVTSFTDISTEWRAERALAAQVEFEALAASISTRLIDCPSDEVDDTITGALGEVTRLFDADIGFVSELLADRTTLRLSHEWRRPGIPPRPDADLAPTSALSWSIRQLDRQPYVLIRSLEDLPADAQAERAAFMAGGNRAFLWARLGGGRNLSGIAGIVWNERAPSTGEEQILSLVRLVGEAFLGALRRRRVAMQASGQAYAFELIARGAPLPETLEAVARLLELHSEGTIGAVLVLAEDGRSLALAAAPSLDTAHQRMLDGLAVVSASPAGQAVRESQVVVVPDVLLDPSFPEARTAADRMGARSITASPIISSRTMRVLGVLLLQGAEAHATDQLDGAWRESCGVLAAVAIERSEDEARLGFQATHDPLTSVSNRSAMLDRLELALARCKRSGRSLAVLFCDLDRFKTVNDLHGHDQGDALLVEVARRIQMVLRPSDTVARFGGDEFVVLCEEIVDAEQALHLAHRVAEAVETEAIAIDSTAVMITVSIGIAVSTDDLDNPEALLRDADMAMYRAKANGRARRELFLERSRGEDSSRLDLFAELGRAVEGDELRLHYQMIVALDGPIRGVEALVRWRHPGRGLVDPAEFLAAAEASGLIVPIGTWVVDEACRQLARWGALDPRLRALSVHVNVSSRQLAEPGMVEAFRASAETAGVSPASLVIEIGENVLLDDTPATARVLAELGRLGTRLALDDYGTANASLTILRQFPVHALKIAPSFIEGVGREREDTAIVQAVIDLAHALDLEAIAEGVETEDQFSALRELGCDSAQGYLVSRPAPADEVTEQLLERLNGQI